MEEKLVKEIRLQAQSVKVRAEEEAGKMVVEGYPVVFNKEAFIGPEEWGWYEKVAPSAFARADMTDVCLKVDHNDDHFILARTRNGSLTLTPDEHGLFMRAELIDTTQNVDVYKMVKAGLLSEGSFAFTVTDEREEVIGGKSHRTILGVGKLFDVSICVNGAYGDNTEIFARSRELVETKIRALESGKNLELLRLRNSNKIKLMEVKK